MVLSVEKTWLMDYGMLRLVNCCRRLILAEFDTKPALHDEKLRDILAHYAGRTRQRSLQEAYAELRLALLELEGDDPPVQVEAEYPSNTRLYRGQPVLTPELEVEGSPEPSSGKTVIYRGRVVQSG